MFFRKLHHFCGQQVYSSLWKSGNFPVNFFGKDVLAVQQEIILLYKKDITKYDPYNKLYI